MIGHDLFVHVWTRHDPLAAAGDGLGPLFNERSCAACHNQAGIGGGGNARNNVFTLSIVRPGGGSLDERADKKLLDEASKILPALVESPGGAPLHRHGVQPGYDQWREQRIHWAEHVGRFAFSPRDYRPEELSPKLQQKIDSIQANRRDNVDEQTFVLQAQGIVDSALSIGAQRAVKIVLSEANTPPLFGLGLIDSIPDSAIEAEARRQADANGALIAKPAPLLGAAKNRVELPVRGRAAGTPDGHVGRFGWKAQHATLEDFALTACAIEIGLQVNRHPQTADPRRHVSSKELGEDLNAAQCQALLAYLHSLPPPREVTAALGEERAGSGTAVFEQLGCAECHVRRLGHVVGLYSDLLLHDMGSVLRGPGYYQIGVLAQASSGKSDAPKPATGAEWRTPPLWGVADSAPYLHDGRATTLDNAILAHGGEGARSARLYREATGDERAALLAFLRSLRAPDQEDPTLQRPMLAGADALRAIANPKQSRTVRKLAKS